MAHAKIQGKGIENTLLYQNQLCCPNYSCDGFLTLVVPKNPTYNSAFELEQCDRFFEWLPKPANQKKKSTQLSQQKGKFLTSLQSKRSLLPQQQKVLIRIEAKAGGQC